MRYAALLGFLLKPLNPDHVSQPKPRSRLIRMTSSHDQVFACLFLYLNRSGRHHSPTITPCHQGISNSRRELLVAATFAIASSQQVSLAEAFCGDTFSQEWVYALKFNEGLVPFVNSDDIDNSKAKTQIFVRVVGDELKEAANKVRPLLLIPGGPGLSHEYLDTIEAVAKSNRRVVSFDPVGTGLSSSVPAQTTATIAAWANPLTLSQQAAAAAEAVGLADKPHHVWAHGTGAAAAILYAAAHPDDVASLTLASPIFGRPPSLVVGSSHGNDKLTSLNPGTSSDPPRGNGPEIAALGSTQSTHPWRLSPDPTSALEPILANKRADLLTGDDSGPPLVCLDDAVKAGSGVLYEAWQPAEVGALEDAVRRIAEVNNGRRLLKCGGIPTLLTSGKRDLLATKASLDLARRLLVNVSTDGSEQSALSSSSSSSSSSVKVSEASPAGNQGNSKLKSPFLAGFPGVEEVVFPRSGHMAHLEEREDYLSKVFDFLAASDNSEK